MINTNEQLPDLDKLRCSMCRQTKHIDLFYGVRQPGKLLKTCSPCRISTPNKIRYNREWRAKKKAQGIKADKRGKTRNAYMREYQRKRARERRALKELQGIKTLERDGT